MADILRSVMLAMLSGFSAISKGLIWQGRDVFTVSDMIRNASGYHGRALDAVQGLSIANRIFYSRTDRFAPPWTLC